MQADDNKILQDFHIGSRNGVGLKPLEKNAFSFLCFNFKMDDNNITL